MNNDKEAAPIGDQVNAPNDDASPSPQGNTLADAVRDEREIPRARLRGQLDREPTEEEIDEYLREHTEGY